MTLPWLFIVLTVMSIPGPGLLQVILVLRITLGIGNTRTVGSAREPRTAPSRPRQSRETSEVVYPISLVVEAP